MTAPAPGPLNPEQLKVLGETRKLSRKLRTARGLALVNAATLACFAFLSIAFSALELDLSLVGLALGALAYNESRGRALLIAADPRGPDRLALNQLLLLGVVLAYCGWYAWQAWAGPDPLQALTAQSPELAASLDQLGEQTGQNLEQISGFARSAALFGYGLIGGLSLVAQGLMAAYYHSLRPVVAALARTPDWARELA